MKTRCELKLARALGFFALATSAVIPFAFNACSGFSPMNSSSVVLSTDPLGSSGASAATTTATDFALPAGAVYARMARNSWGVNGEGDATKTAAALSFIVSRWLRVQLDQNDSHLAFVNDVQKALVSGAQSDPNLKVNLLLNDYLQNVVNGVDLLPWSAQQSIIINDFLPITGKDGKTIVKAIEGPNEINNQYVGTGAHGPNSVARTDNNFALAQAAFLAWAKALYP